MLKWTVGLPVLAKRLNKTGNGFDNISNITYNTDGTISEFDGDGFHFKLLYNTNLQITRIERWNAGNTTKLEQDDLTYNSDGQFTGSANTNFADIL